MSNANKNNEEFRSIMDKALAECKRLDLPEHLVARVRDWFLYTWEQQKTLDEKKLVEKLPLKLQTDLALSVHYNTLSKVQLFQDADRALLRDLVLKLKPVIFLPGDMICRKGDVGKEMYIVNQGILEVVGDLNQVFVELKEGSVFGEIRCVPSLWRCPEANKALLLGVHPSSTRVSSSCSSLSVAVCWPSAATTGARPTSAPRATRRCSCCPRRT